MNLTLALRCSMILIVFLCLAAISADAQSDIRIGKAKANHVDKQKKKQGDWIFFDEDGNIAISCIYKNDEIIGPIVYYRNTDTVFVRYAVAGGLEPFDVHLNGKVYRGSYTTEKDSVVEAELEAADAPTQEVARIAREYRFWQLSPQYHFRQKPLADYMSAAFSSSRFVFNKNIYVLLTLTASGFIKSVSFPPEKNTLSADEETELHRIYAGMPRWQPLFYGNKTLPVTLAIGDGSSISITTFSR